MTQSLPNPKNHSAYNVPGLHRGLIALESLANESEALTLSEIARALDISRSSAFRLVYTLRQLNFIREAEQKGTYTLGARVLNLGFAYLNQQPITSVARKHLASLRDKTGVSAHLSVLEGHDVLYLGSHQARTGYVSNMVTGTRVEAYALAAGWVLLGQLSDAELEAFCADIDMRAHTEHTPTSFTQLKARVDETRDKGYFFSRGYHEAGGSSIAAPVFDNAGHVVACVNISGPDVGFDFARIDQFYIPETRDVALKISRELGFAT
ncbi:MAG: IclR family transcriptional regulator [Rhodobacteraceae bacterium]|nr:IclR family transcriptional regulator [Paracoccaceae bacterium]